MSIDGWSLIRFLHVLAAMVFVGGQLVLSGMVLPVIRKELEPERSGPLARKAARLFGHTANIVLLPTLIATGLALMSHRGTSSWPWWSCRWPCWRRTGSLPCVAPRRPGPGRWPVSPRRC